MGWGEKGEGSISTLGGGLYKLIPTPQKITILQTNSSKNSQNPNQNLSSRAYSLLVDKPSGSFEELVSRRKVEFRWLEASLATAPLGLIGEEVRRLTDPFPNPPVLMPVTLEYAKVRLEGLGVEVRICGRILEAQWVVERIPAVREFGYRLMSSTVSPHQLPAPEWLDLLRAVEAQPPV